MAIKGILPLTASKNLYMKKCLPLLLLLSASMTVLAKKMSGFVVFHNHDTAYVQLRITDDRSIFSGHYNIYEGITATDSAGHDTTYRPADIDCYGYSDKHGMQLFRVRPMRDSTLHFQEVIVEGPRAALYFYANPGYVGPGSIPIDFTFQRADGTFLFLKDSDKMRTLRDKLQAFYGGDPEVDKLIHSKF